MGILNDKEHNHPSNPQRKEATEQRAIIRNQIGEMPRSKPSRVLADVRTNISDEVFVEMGSNKALELLISRQKKRLFGNVDVADVLNINLPDSLTVLRGQSILLYDSRQHRLGEKDVVLVFSHPSKQLNHHPSLSSFLEAFLKDVDKQQDIARAAVLQQKRKRRRRYVLQEQHIMETLEGAMYDNDEDLLDLLTLLGLQIQGYVNGLRDNNRRDSDDDDGIIDVSSIPSTSFNS
uniref:1-phosphatidylinositol 4-kinase n=1 Tax=Meloidogyne hapla TaxID=6305 RepID=A0A1I8C0S7_MELHA